MPDLEIDAAQDVTRRVGSGVTVATSPNMHFGIPVSWAEYYNPMYGTFQVCAHAGFRANPSLSLLDIKAEEYYSQLRAQ